MSYYYNYYIGYEEDGKIYPLGPYDSFGNIAPAVSKSRSFASDLHEIFKGMSDEQISGPLRNAFEYEDWDGKKKVNVKYLPVEKLPIGSYIKQGYYLIEDVLRYKESEYFEGFYDVIDTEVYNALAENEMKFGKPEMRKDDEGYEYQPKTASDYMFFTYPDYHSKEYEAFILREVLDMLWTYKKYNYVILETEG